MTDFKVVDVPGMLAVKSSISDDNGDWLPDPEWNREAAESQFVLAEVLAEKRLCSCEIAEGRAPDLVIRWSDLTATGQAFVRGHYDKWMRSIDRTGMAEAQKRKKLLRRWDQFAKATEKN